jgi:hypothetical protein
LAAHELVWIELALLIDDELVRADKRFAGRSRHWHDEMDGWPLTRIE